MGVYSLTDEFDELAERAEMSGIRVGRVKTVDALVTKGPSTPSTGSNRSGIEECGPGDFLGPPVTA